MILPKPQDVIHKLQLYRLLTAIIDDKTLSRSMMFKGGTCAAMLGWLDRFSIDLDFDLIGIQAKSKTAERLTDIFSQLDLKLKQRSKKELFFVLQYVAKGNERRTLKLSIVTNQTKTNQYQVLKLPEIDRYCWCQTKETMFANKLVAPTDRFKKYHTIAGRDIYDIHYFFSQGFPYSQKVITERTGQPVLAYLKQLYRFIDKKVTDKIITQDLSYLLPSDKFQKIRKILKSEALIFLQNETKN